MNKKPLKSFPLICHCCGKREFTMAKIDYPAEVLKDGHLHKFIVKNLEISICRCCGEKVFTEKVDDQIEDTLNQQLKINKKEK